jgi:4-aminobutyrate aminotransferase
VAAVRDVRGVGLMLGVEFDSHEAADAVQETCFHNGLLVLECGESSLRLCPPLVVDAAAVDAAVEIFGAALRNPGADGGVEEVGG